MSEPQRERIRESYQQKPNTLRVDRENAVIFGVAVLNERSENGRLYESSARRGVVDVINRNGGHPVAYEHEDLDAVERGRGVPRRVLDRNGQLRNAREEGTSVFADWHLNESKSETAGLLTDADKFPRNLCLSPEFDRDHYEATIGNDGVLHVHTITDMLDVAVVSRGGTTKSLKESLQPKPEDQEMSDSAVIEKTLQTVDSRLKEQEERRRISEEITGLKASNDNLQAANKRLTEEKDALQRKLDQFEKIDRIIEMAKSQFDLDIDRNFAKTLAPLEDESIKFFLDDRKQRLAEASNKSSSDSSSSKNHFRSSLSSDSKQSDNVSNDWLPTSIA